MTSTKFRLLTTTIVAGAIGAAAPAWAQNASQPGQQPTAPTVGGSSTSALPTDTNANPSTENAPQGEVIVTGSRIANPNATSASPVTVVSAQEARLEGTVRTEDLLNNLPGVFADQGSTISNGSNGTATVNLRGLGAIRTLVLINGRRLGPGDTSSSAADLNFIPATLIDRVEVLTGGASSTYGSDAVSGVVNFIMNTNFEGLRLDATYSLLDHDNNNPVGQAVANSAAGRGFPSPQGHEDLGGTRNLTATFGVGSSDGKGHIVAYAGYRQTDPILESNYDYSHCSLAETGGAFPGFACSGSGTTSPAVFRFPGATAQTLNAATGNTFRPYNSATDAFNFAPYNYDQRNDTRYTAGAFANYEINEHFNPYLEFMFMDDLTTAQIAPSGLFGQTVTLACNSPLLSAQEAATICGANAGTATNVTGSISKRNVEGGGRDNNIRHTDYRYVLGLKGAIDSAFSYDAYGQYSKTLLNENYQNDFSVNRTRQALNVVRNAAGQLVCADANAVAAGCVPYNIFAVGGVTPAALAYLQTPGFEEGSTEEYVANASITGKLEKYGIKSPFADDGVGVAIGVEYRKETLQLLTDAEFSSGDLAGQGGPTKPVSGTFNVVEQFAELSVPLVDHKPFFESLVVTGGYRHSRYSTAGDTNTYKGEVEYQPIDLIRFRASYNRAVRAPNIQELFAPTGQSLFSGSDPCALANPTVAPLPTTATVNGNTFAQCARTGVTAADFGTIAQNPAAQLTQFSGGNAALTPEVSDTYSAGAVIQPKGVLHGLVISADYFNIKVNNTIGTIGAALSLQQCLQTGNPTFCNLIQRDPTPGATLGSLFLGTVGQVVNTNQNVGKLQTRGVDVAGSYRFDFDRVGFGRLGSLGLDYVATFLDKLSESPGITVTQGGQSFSSYNCRGLYGLICGTPSPVFRSKLRATINFPGNVQLSGNWRHLSGVYADQSTPNPFLGGTAPQGPLADTRIPAFDYLDISTAIRVADKFSFRVGANNVLDRDPPIIGSANLPTGVGNGNTFPQVYDALGRYVFAGFTVDF